tara:strand:+ start:479 stop:661 length:183 start_codon:yes stop_codon:yes gene_type:complete
MNLAIRAACNSSENFTIENLAIREVSTSIESTEAEGVPYGLRIPDKGETKDCIERLLMYG